MKRCPSCNLTYDDTYSFCMEDAMPLTREAGSTDLGATLVAPPSSDLPLTQAASTGQVPGYQQSYRQPYQQPYLLQWTPPQPPPQWNVPPATQRGNKKIILVVVGLLLVTGIGLAIYLRIRGRASYYSGNYSSETTFSSGDRVVIRSRAGTFKPNDSHYSVELEAGSGTTGTVVDVKGDLLVVKWDDQTFYESESKRLVSVSSFISTIHKSYMEKR